MGLVSQNFVDLTQDGDFDGVKWAGCPYHAEASILVELEELVSLDVPIVSHHIDDIYRVYCDIGIIGIFEAQVAFEKVKNIVHPNQILSDYKNDSFWSTVEMRSVATFILRLDFNVSNSKIEGSYFLALEHWKEFGEVIEAIDNHVLEELEFSLE